MRFTIEQMKDYIKTFGECYEWHEDYCSKRGLLLDINGNDNSECVPSYAGIEDCTIGKNETGKYSIHYALKHGVPLTYWYYIKIKNDYKLIDIRDLNFDVPMGETEDISQLHFISRTFYIKFLSSKKFEDCITSISLN